MALGGSHNERSVPVIREPPILFIGLLDLSNDRGRGIAFGYLFQHLLWPVFLYSENAMSPHACSLLLYASAHNTKPLMCLYLFNIDALL